MLVGWELADALARLTDSDVQTALATDRAELTAPWLLAQASLGGAPPQRLGLAASTSGLEALRAPSAKDPGAAYLVIFPEALLTT